MELTLGPALDGDTPLTPQNCGLLPGADLGDPVLPDVERKRPDDTEGGTCD